MYIKFHRRSQHGFSLVELLVSSALFGLLGLTLASVYMFSTRSFVSIVNYAELDKINRTAMDSLSKEIRQAQQVTDATTNSITIINGDGLSVSYIFNVASGNLIRTASDGSSKTLLSSCTLLGFNIYQRNPIGGTYDIYPAATNNWQATAKVISLTWKATRPMPSGFGVSENIQTARVVIRKQH
jgi:prepilin-type N-terminal cleavage/methylation domain-containing protein